MCTWTGGAVLRRRRAGYGGATPPNGRNFLFGGSDIVMLFQNPKLKFDAQVGTHYLQGQQIGRVE